jgi:hypothetical protein
VTPKERVLATHPDAVCVRETGEVIGGDDESSYSVRVTAADGTVRVLSAFCFTPMQAWREAAEDIPSP